MRIRDDLTLDWRDKYRVVFNDIAPEIAKTGVDVEWYDPDASYEDDVRAYVDALEERAVAADRIDSLLTDDAT